MTLFNDASVSNIPAWLGAAGFGPVYDQYWTSTSADASGSIIDTLYYDGITNFYTHSSEASSSIVPHLITVRGRDQCLPGKSIIASLIFLMLA